MYEEGDPVNPQKLVAGAGGGGLLPGPPFPHSFRTEFRRGDILWSRITARLDSGISSGDVQPLMMITSAHRPFYAVDRGQSLRSSDTSS